MPYQILPNLIFIFAVLGIILIILRHLPEAVSSLDEHEQAIDEKLQKKGLPAMAIWHAQVIFKTCLKRAWNFILEAKDLKPGAVAGYNIRKLFKPKSPKLQIRQSPAPAEARADETESPKTGEVYFLELIKQNPKNLALYNDLGKFYLDAGNVPDAADIYRYLSSHSPNSAEYHSRLAYCYYGLKEYARATEHYKKAIALDPTQPNRYYNLAVSQEAEEKFSDAGRNLEQAIAMEPRNVKYYVTLSNVYVKMGQPERAKGILLKAKKQEPENKQVFEKLKQLV